MKETELNIKENNCNCQKSSSADVTAVVEDVVRQTGGEPEKVIMILQEVQKKLLSGRIYGKCSSSGGGVLSGA